MHEWGQPMHAYDARYVKDGQFHVRRSKAGEKYTTLDGKERILSPEMLIISDTEKVIGMPIMGGANSEISESTTDIALEAASFLPAIVRRSSRLLGLSSESSLRFERGIDAATTKQASDRAAYLISKYCSANGPVKIGAFVAGGTADYKPTHIELRQAEIKRHLNLNLPDAEVKDLLGRLGFSSVSPSDKSNKLVFAVPSFRKSDITREIDLIEEVCRIYGYDNIKEEPPAFLALSQMPENIKAPIRTALSGQGLCEASIKSFAPNESISIDGKNGNESLPINQAINKDVYLTSHDPQKAIVVLNALSPEHQALRQSLLPGLIKALKYNVDHSDPDVWLFEIGYAYFKHQTKEKTSEPAYEQLNVAGILSGNRQLSLWKDASEHASGSNTKSNTSKLNFYDAKGILENLFESLHICNDHINYSKKEPSPSPMHPGQTAHIIYSSDSKNGSKQEKIEIGWLGQLHPASAKELELDTQTYLFELNVEALNKLRKKPSFQSVSTLPPVMRDLTIDLPQNINNTAVADCVKEVAVNLKKLDLVSIFPLNAEQKSLSYRLTFQSDTETLKSEEIEQVINNIRSKLKEKLNASFRA